MEGFIDTVNSVIWSNWLVYLCLGAGAYFTLATLFLQIRCFPDMIRQLKSGESSDQGISSFQSLMISLAGRVGVGNIAGVATAIAFGGPGAVFWMWLVALLGSATSFIECCLAQIYKETDRDTDEYRGGPAYYMSRGLGWTPLATIFSVAIAITFGWFYNAFQTNAISDSLATSFGQDSTAFKAGVGIAIVIVSGLIIVGGVQRIASMTQFIVPFMALAYLVVGLIVVALNFDKVPDMIVAIVGSAFGFREAAGATLGLAMLKGIQRGLFSNEAGEGSAPNAAATATVSHPVKQGLVQTLGVYFDTLVVCSITAFIILLGTDFETFGSDSIEGVTLTQNALSGTVGDWGIHFVTFILFFLAFSSILGNYYLAESNVEYLSDKKWVLWAFRIIVLAFVFYGAVAPLGTIFDLADTGAAIMVLLNILAIVPLSGVAIKLLKNYNEQRRKGVDPVFHRDMLPELKNVECWDGSDPVTRRSAEDRRQLQHQHDLGDHTNLREY